MGSLYLIVTYLAYVGFCEIQKKLNNMNKNKPTPEDDFPFADLLGIKTKNETTEEKFRRRLREIAKKFPPPNQIEK